MKRYDIVLLVTLWVLFFGSLCVAGHLRQAWQVNTPEPPVAEATETAQAPMDVIEQPKEVIHLACTVEYEPVTLEVCRQNSTYTAEDLELLALVIYQEAGSDTCNDDTRLKVGTVVLNRVADDRFPNTIREVVTQPAQYGRLYWTGAVWPERVNDPSEAAAVLRAYDCAERLLQGERHLPEGAVWQAEFIQGVEVVAHQDGFYFCR